MKDLTEQELVDRIKVLARRGRHKAVHAALDELKKRFKDEQTKSPSANTIVVEKGRFIPEAFDSNYAKCFYNDEYKKNRTNKGE